MYGKCGSLVNAEKVFDRIPHRTIFTRNAMIGAYVTNGVPLGALELYREMQVSGISLDACTFPCVLEACGGLKDIHYGAEIHDLAIKCGYASIVFVANSLVSMYAKRDDLNGARQLFNREREDVVSWNSIISAYSANGQSIEALRLFREMQKVGLATNTYTFVATFQACEQSSFRKLGMEIHAAILKSSHYLDIYVANALVVIYARRGTVENSYNIFNYPREKDLVLRTSMINANGMHGHGKAPIDLFRRMEIENLVPDHITFLALLYATKLNLSCRKLEPWPEHYACLVDHLGRANHLEEAYQFVKSMQFEPTAAVWCALLESCWVHSNKELGEIAARKLLELDLENPENYVLVSNVFAATGRWKDVEEVRMRMKGKMLNKNPACSWIEVGNKVHTYVHGKGQVSSTV